MKTSSLRPNNYIILVVIFSLRAYIILIYALFYYLKWGGGMTSWKPLAKKKEEC